MAFSIRKFLEGIRLIPKSSGTITSAGEMEVLSSDNKLQYHNGTTKSPVVTEDHSASLSNKTLVSPLINGSIQPVTGNLSLDATPTGGQIYITSTGNLNLSSTSSSVLIESVSINNSSISEVSAIAAPSGSRIQLNSDISINNKAYISYENNSDSGSAITLNRPNAVVCNLNGSITSISKITAPTISDHHQYIILTNRTGVDVTITNFAGGVGSILTGTGQDFVFKANSSISLFSDQSTGWWYILGAPTTRVASVNQFTSSVLTPSYYPTSQIDVVLVDASITQASVYLSSVAFNGKKIIVKKIDSSSNPVLVIGNGSSIDNYAPYSLINQYDSIELVWYSTSWYII